VLLAFGRRWALLFSLLLALTVPLRYRALHSPGVALRPVLEAAGSQLLGRPVALFSDSADLWIWTGILLVSTALAAAMWVALGRRTAANEARLWYGLHTGAAWWLALQLLLYGSDKLVKHQFYLPEPNTLYTPLGLLPPDLAYWSVMGISRSYSVFAGLLEVGPGLLLLWGRTRLLGGLLAAAVLLNVLAINIGFGISVKLWSGFLLGLALLVAAPGLRTLYAGLVREQWRPPSRPLRPAGWQGRWVGAVRGVLLGVLLLETAGPLLEGEFLNDDEAPRPPLHGAYSVQAEIPGAASPPRRLFVHRQGYFITQSVQDSLRSYSLSYAPGRLLLRDEAGRPSELRYRLDRAGLHLRGTLGADSVRWLARPLPWRQLPLLRPDSWVAE
jgi:hypothetical protein